MANEKKALLKNFKILIEDLMDNYEKYTDKEKAQIKELFQNASELNAILDKYDIETEFSWEEYCATICTYFSAS